MNFDQITSFYLAATLGTFAKAAAQLNTTQPAISARIASLERELGAKLFDRAGHRVALTPQGRSFLKNAEKLLLLQSEALAGFAKDRLNGIIRVGASDTMAITWLPDFLIQLRALYPLVSIELLVGPTYRLHQGLLARDIDVAFLVGPLPDSEVVNSLLCDCPVVLAAAPQMRLGGRQVAVAELGAFDVYTLERLTRPYQDLARLNRLHGAKLRLSPINSLQTVVLLVQKGLGIGAIPLCVIEDDVAGGRLEVVNTDLKMSDIRFTASYLQGPHAHVGEAFTTIATDVLRRRPISPGIKNLC